MSSLVSDFLINPILRQARRFSNPNSERFDSTSQRTRLVVTDRRHGSAIVEGIERMEDLPVLETGNDGRAQTISDAPLVSSPVEEHGNGDLGEDITQVGSGRLESAGPARSSSQVVPLRLASLRSEPGLVEEDVTSNPSFGIPRQFRTHSASTGSTGHGHIASGDSAVERQSIHEVSYPAPVGRRRNSSLPADDGMGELRREIISVQGMNVTQEEKARMMHQLLTQSYDQARVLVHGKPEPIQAALNTISQERPITPGSLGSFNFWPGSHATDSALSGVNHTFHLSPSDLCPTYAPLEEFLEPDDGSDNGEESSERTQALGCQHYTRNVKLQCSACDRWYTCRMCHDEAEDHVLNRKATKNMLCMICGCAQRAGEFCVGCGERTAWYYCDVCKLWDNDSQKNIYHCNDCGICRKGRGLGKDFFHCKTCGVCISTNIDPQDHKCIERVSDCDCPICGEYMFTSPHPVVFMLCGHSIHQKCYYEHMKSSYKCPICSRSTVNMETQFRNLDRSIESQPMPPQFRDTKAMISCNDCFAKSAVTYHWLGLKCAICDSYNTVQLSIISDPAVEVPPIETGVSTLVPAHEQVPLNGPRPSTGPVRQRRHSFHLNPGDASGSVTRFSPYDVRQRIVRSVSPPRAPFFSEELGKPDTASPDASGDEDDLDFWGRDELRSVTSGENVRIDEEDGDDYEDVTDSDSDMDCEEEEEDGEVDRFEIFGHR